MSNRERMSNRIEKCPVCGEEFKMRSLDQQHLIKADLDFFWFEYGVKEQHYTNHLLEHLLSRVRI